MDIPLFQTHIHIHKHTECSIAVCIHKHWIYIYPVTIPLPHRAQQHDSVCPQVQGFLQPCVHRCAHSCLCLPAGASIAPFPLPLSGSSNFQNSCWVLNHHSPGQSEWPESHVQLSVLLAIVSSTVPTVDSWTPWNSLYLWLTLDFHA